MSMAGIEWHRLELLAQLEGQADRTDLPSDTRLLCATAASALRQAWES